MKQEFKDKWIAALRDGSYKQGTGFLRMLVDNTRFCCLGVAVDLMGAQWNDTTCVLPDGAGYNCNAQAGELQRLFPTMKEQLIDQLMHMNDRGEPFATIADYIETEVQVTK